MEQIITTLLDTDLYKFKMQQFIFHQHKNHTGIYQFKCRDDDFELTDEMIDEIKSQISKLSELFFSNEELSFLYSLKLFKSDYITFLSGFKINLDYIHISKESIYLQGPLEEISLYDIYLLAIINEVYYKLKYNYNDLLDSARHKLRIKIDKFNHADYRFKFVEFGTRRRLSREWQEEMVLNFSKYCSNYIGTSNVALALKLNSTPIGANGHEVIQLYEAIPGIPLEHINYYFMEDWLKEYPINEVMVTDTLTTKLFLNDLTYDLANKLRGVRNDSGDPFDWGNQIIQKYKQLNINPKDKTLLFSNGLSFTNAQLIYDYFKDKTNVSFGIGTFCSNDTFASPLNIVFKLQYVDNIPVGKLTDDTSKAIYPVEFEQIKQYI